MTQKILRAFSRLGAWASTKLENNSEASRPNSPFEFLKQQIQNQGPSELVLIETEQPLQDQVAELVAHTFPTLGENMSLFVIMARKEKDNNRIAAGVSGRINPEILRLLLLGSLNAIDNGQFRIEPEPPTAEGN